MTRAFQFHGCLSPQSKQSDVLKICGITQLLDAALAGYHATVFAYGQTGSGKTYTMSGHEDVIESDDYAGEGCSNCGDMMHMIGRHDGSLVGHPGAASLLGSCVMQCNVHEAR